MTEPLANGESSDCSRLKPEHVEQYVQHFRRQSLSIRNVRIVVVIMYICVLTTVWVGGENIFNKMIITGVLLASYSLVAAYSSGLLQQLQSSVVLFAGVTRASTDTDTYDELIENPDEILPTRQPIMATAIRRFLPNRTTSTVPTRAEPVLSILERQANRLAEQPWWHRILIPCALIVATVVAGLLR